MDFERIAKGITTWNMKKSQQWFWIISHLELGDLFASFHGLFHGSIICRLIENAINSWCIFSFWVVSFWNCGEELVWNSESVFVLWKIMCSMITMLQTWMDRHVIVGFWEMRLEEPARLFYSCLHCKCLFRIWNLFDFLLWFFNSIKRASSLFLLLCFQAKECCCLGIIKPLK